MKRQGLRILAAMFCMGVFGTIAQVTFMREMLVTFFGNELCIGIILGGWLVGIGMGAAVAGFLLRRLPLSPPAGCPLWLLPVFLLAAAGFPVQVYIARIVRLILGVPAGEYAPLIAVAVSSLLILLPTCAVIGLTFPAACASLARIRAASDSRAGGHGASAVSMVYSIESAGSMAAGLLLTFVLLPRLTPSGVVLVGSGAVALGAACLRRGAFGPVLAALAAGMFVSAVLRPDWLQRVEDRTLQARWSAFGALTRERGTLGADARPPVRLVYSADTVYQNLAVTESEGQYALYGNGLVMFAFPDPITEELGIHFAMAQNPGAQRVLLIGGNPAGDIPELLKYPVRRLVYVEIDPGIGTAVRAAMGIGEGKAMDDPRVVRVAEDAPRFVRRCAESFDAVLIRAPEPSTAAANRFFTIEFYRHVRRLLAPRGFMVTAVSSSERLRSEAADLGASVYQTLRAVFPVVNVTAETRNRFFAGGADAGLTFDRQTLYERSRRSAISCRYFRPEYFLGADEIDGEKTRYVEERFSAEPVPLNTTLRPVTYFYNLVLWSRYSGSGVERPLHRLRTLTATGIARGVTFAGCLVLFAGWTARWGRRLGRRAADGTGAGWVKGMLALVVASTGLCGMALEIVLMFVVQSLYGYVYTRMGLIVAMFMLGLVLGAPSGRRLGRGMGWRPWAASAGVGLVLLAVCVGLPAWVAAASAGRTTVGGEAWVYGLMVIVGWGVGAQFPLANRLFADARGSVAAGAAWLNAADHIGAALGGALVGVALIPVVGVGGSCFLLAVVQVFGLMSLLSAFTATPILPESSPHTFRSSRSGGPCSA
jgi:spermidine synthase